MSEERACIHTSQRMGTGLQDCGEVSARSHVAAENGGGTCRCVFNIRNIYMREWARVWISSCSWRRRWPLRDRLHVCFFSSMVCTNGVTHTAVCLICDCVCAMSAIYTFTSEQMLLFDCGLLRHPLPLRHRQWIKIVAVCVHNKPEWCLSLCELFYAHRQKDTDSTGQFFGGWYLHWSAPWLHASPYVRMVSMYGRSRRSLVIGAAHCTRCWWLDCNDRGEAQEHRLFLSSVSSLIFVLYDDIAIFAYVVPCVVRYFELFVCSLPTVCCMRHMAHNLCCLRFVCQLWLLMENRCYDLIKHEEFRCYFLWNLPSLDKIPEDGGVSHSHKLFCTIWDINRELNWLKVIREDLDFISMCDFVL